MVILDEAAAPTRRSNRRSVRVDRPWPPGPTFALTAFAVVYVLHSWRYLTGAPGLNHDGQNVGVFAMGSRALRDLGPVGSRLGSHLAMTDVVYANHPPLIYWLTAVSESVFGVHPWATRLPTVLAALSLIVLVPRFLRTIGHAPGVAALATIASLGSVMFLVYGAMLDTPMLGLPLSIATLTEWVRVRRGASTSSRTLVALTILSCLASWQAVACCLVAAVVGLVTSPDADPADRGPFRDMLIAAVMSVVAIGCWIRWSYGSFDDIGRQFLRRSGHSDAAVSVGDAITVQSGYLGDVLGWALLVLGGVGVILAGRRRAIRATVLVVVAVVAGYSLVFWQAATYHDYWHYWMLLPISMGVAELAELTVARWGRVGRIAGALVAVALVGSSLVGTSVAEQSADTGFDVAALVEATPLPADQTAIYELGFGEPTNWIAYDTDLPVLPLQMADLPRAAALHPTWVLFIYCNSPRRDGGAPPCLSIAHASIPDGPARTSGGIMSVPLAAAAAAT